MFIKIRESSEMTHGNHSYTTYEVEYRNVFTTEPIKSLELCKRRDGSFRISVEVDAAIRALLSQEVRASGLPFSNILCHNDTITFKSFHPNLIFKFFQIIKSHALPTQYQQEYLCRMSECMMTDPVRPTVKPKVAYERSQIVHWLNYKQLHPASNVKLTVEQLQEDKALKGEIDSFIARLEAGATLLHWAAEKNYLDAAKELLKKEENFPYLKAQDAMGRTPLHGATMMGNLDIVKLLLEHATTDVTLQDTAGNSALELARHAQERNEELEHLLEQAQLQKSPAFTPLANHQETDRKRKREDDEDQGNDHAKKAKKEIIL